MRLDSRHMLRRNVRERLIAPQGVFHENASAVCPTGESALRTLTVSELAEQCLLELNASRRGEPSADVYGVELLRRASIHDDLETWAAFQHSLEEIVLTWFHDHPGREAACRMHSERHFVALAFEQLRQAILQRQVACETLSGALLYLRASLNGAILETARASSRPKAVCAHGSAEQGLQGNHQSLEVWNRVQATLSSERERQLAYLLYHCGLSPEEIVRYCPQEWSDIREVTRLRRIILKQLTKGLI